MPERSSEGGQLREKVSPVNEIIRGNETLLRDIFGHEDKRMLAIAEVALRIGARQIQKFFGASPETLKTVAKAADQDTPQTVADREGSKRIRWLLEKAFPDTAINDEEAAMKAGERGIFYVDPLDGTGPFTREQPYSTNGLIYYENGEPVVAAAVMPLEAPSPKLYVAERGQGAFQIALNERLVVRPGTEKRLHVSEITDPKKGVVYVDGNFYDTTRDAKLAWMAQATQRCRGVRSIGSNINQWLCVADGRGEATITDSVGGHYDLTGLLMVREAGGFAANLAGEFPKPGDQLAVGANTEKLLSELIRIAQECYPPDFNEFGFRGRPINS